MPGICPQHRARPLPGQSSRDLLLAREAERLQPLPDSAATGGALGGERRPQLIGGELLAREQQKAEWDAMPSRSAFRDRAQAVDSVPERAFHTLLHAIPQTLNHDSVRLPAVAPPEALRVAAIKAAAGRRELFQEVAPGQTPGIEMKACSSHKIFLRPIFLRAVGRDFGHAHAIISI